MIAIKATFQNGNIISTGINATIEEARTYYLWQLFNLGTVSDDLQKCTKVEQIEEEATK